MDFSVSFHLVLMPDFVDIFPTKAASAQYEKYLA